jgi:hypothetical protein
MVNFLDKRLRLKVKDWVQRSKVQSSAVSLYYPMESMVKEKSAQRLTLNREPGTL